MSRSFQTVTSWERTHALDDPSTRLPPPPSLFAIAFRLIARRITYFPSHAHVPFRPSRRSWRMGRVDLRVSGFAHCSTRKSMIDGARGSCAGATVRERCDRTRRWTEATSCTDRRRAAASSSRTARRPALPAGRDRAVGARLRHERRRQRRRLTQPAAVPAVRPVVVRMPAANRPRSRGRRPQPAGACLRRVHCDAAHRILAGRSAPPGRQRQSVTCAAATQRQRRPRTATRSSGVRTDTATRTRAPPQRACAASPATVRRSSAAGKRTTTRRSWRSASTQCANGTRARSTQKRVIDAGDECVIDARGGGRSRVRSGWGSRG